MKNLQNLHTHSTFCDGKDTPEQMVLAAIEKGFDSIGFSGHTYMSFYPKISMSPQTTKEYKKEIIGLKKKYEGVIDIFLGLEVEMYSNTDISGCEYLIGSTHYFHINDEYIGFDRNADAVKSVIDQYFDADPMKYARAYYEQISRLPEFGEFDVIGHFDIVAKHCEIPGFLDTDKSEYLNYAYDAIDALKGRIPFFEVNTGAIARGYRTTPYPSIQITKRLLENGFLPIISSDCHNKNMLDCGFEEAVALLELCGAKERYILTGDGFKAVPLK